MVEQATNSVDVEQREALPRELSSEMERIRQLFLPHEGDAEDLITYAKEVVRIRSALSGSRLSNEGVREALPTDKYGETAIDRIRDKAENGVLDPQFRADLRTLLALASLQPDSLSEERMAFEDARPLIESIAAWERKNGTIAAIMPHEYAAFMETLKKAAVHGSARAALARGKMNG